MEIGKKETQMAKNTRVETNIQCYMMTMNRKSCYYYQAMFHNGKAAGKWIENGEEATNITAKKKYGTK